MESLVTLRLEHIKMKYVFLIYFILLTVVCFGETPGAKRKIQKQETQWDFNVVVHAKDGDAKTGTINFKSTTGYDSLGMAAASAGMGSWMIASDAVSPWIAGAIIPVGIVFNRAMAKAFTPREFNVQGSDPFQPPQPPPGKQPIVYDRENLKALLEKGEELSFRKGADGKLYIGEAIEGATEVVALVEQPIPAVRQQPFSIKVQMRPRDVRRMQRLAQGSLVVPEGKPKDVKQLHLYMGDEGKVDSIAVETQGGRMTGLGDLRSRRSFWNPVRPCTAAYRFVVGLP